MISTIEIGNLNDEQNRLYTFGPWFNNEVDKKSLARAGFFYLSESDHVKCVFCGVEIGVWSRGDNPFIEHKRHSPDCRFLKDCRSVNNIPISETQDLLAKDLALLRKSNDTSTSGHNTILEKLSSERVAETARHPSYADKTERLKSFMNWPSGLKQTPGELSDAGFFYLGVGDEVKCFHCGGCLRNFASSDQALAEHKKYYFKKCKFIQLTYKNIRSNTYKLENRRPIKATTEQIQYLKEFMRQNKKLQSGNLVKNRDAYVSAWKDLTKTLNDLDGAHKDVRGWKEVWRNYKYNQKRKLTDVDEMNTASTSSTDTLSYIGSLSIRSSDNLSNNSSSPDGTTTIDFEEFEMDNFINMDGMSSNITTFETPTMLAVVSEPIKNDEPTNDLDYLDKKITELRFKYEKLQLEMEKIKLELDMKVKQKELIQKQNELQIKFDEI